MSCKHWRQRCVSISLSHFTFTECRGIPQPWMRTSERWTDDDGYVFCDLLFLFALCPSQCCVFIRSNIYACGCQCLYTPHTLSLPHIPNRTLSDSLRSPASDALPLRTILRQCLYTENECIFHATNFFLVRSPLFRMFAVYARCMVFSHSLALRLFWSVGGYFAPSHERKIKKKQKIIHKHHRNTSDPSFQRCMKYFELTGRVGISAATFYQCYQNNADDSKGTALQCDTISIKYKLHRKRK